MAARNKSLKVGDKQSLGVDQPAAGVLVFTHNSDQWGAKTGGKPQAPKGAAG